jgi:hypothetical protein
VVQVGGVAAATGTGGRDTQPHPGPAGADAGPRACGGDAYQDGVWLGRAIVPLDAIAPGEAPPEWNEVVRFVSSCVFRVAAGTRRWVAKVEPAGASQPWRYAPLIPYGWGYPPSAHFAHARS